MDAPQPFIDPRSPFRTVQRVLVIGLDGATWDLLKPLSELGIMPNLTELMRRSANICLNSTSPCITPVAWTSFQTGSDICGHGIYDYRYWDHLAGRLRLNHAGRISGSTLYETVAAADRHLVSLNLPMTHPPRLGEPNIVLGGLDSPSLAAVLQTAPEFAADLQQAGIDYDLRSIWRRRPRSMDELRSGVDETVKAFQGRAAAALVADARCDWSLMVVQFQNLDSLQHRLWHLLDAEGLHSGQPVPAAATSGVQVRSHEAWQATSAAINEAYRAMHALDRACGLLLELAARRSAAVVALSDHGFGAFQGKISVPRVLERQGLLVPASGYSRWVHQATRWRWKAQRWLWKRGNKGGRSAALALEAKPRIALDWDRSPAVTLHGDLGAMVYINRPERFGGGPVRTATELRQTEQRVCAALKVARHPRWDTPLFTEVYAVRDRWDCEPLDRCWPDVIGIPAEGWHTRSKWNPSDTVILGDDELSGTHRHEGVLMLDAPGVTPGFATNRVQRAYLWDVAPTILQMLGIRVPSSMTGQPLVGHSHVASAASTLACPMSPVLSGELSADQMAVVEQRLRDLGYMD